MCDIICQIRNIDSFSGIFNSNRFWSEILTAAIPVAVPSLLVSIVHDATVVYARRLHFNTKEEEKRMYPRKDAKKKQKESRRRPG